MKTLEKTFSKNCDKSGIHTFTQVKRNGLVCIYERKSAAGNIVGYEVFVTKEIMKGSPMAGGGMELEDREGYPGKSSFGRSAWFCNSIESANSRFDKLVTKALPVVESEDEEEKTITIPVVRVSAARVSNVVGFESPPVGWKGTQKELAAFLGMTNYKEAYTPLQKWLGAGILKVVGERESATRGKKAKIFGRPA